MTGRLQIMPWKNAATASFIEDNAADFNRRTGRVPIVLAGPQINVCAQQYSFPVLDQLVIIAKLQLPVKLWLPGDTATAEKIVVPDTGILASVEPE